MAHSMPDGNWRLSFDAVCSIMAASPPPTISALMKSCHALYAEGPRHLLCDGVGLFTEIQIILFTNFMLVQDPSRLALLRKLELSFSFPFHLMFSEDTGQRLEQLLLHPALALETFILHGAALVLSSGQTLSGTILCSSFGRLNTLKHLVLHGVGGDSGSIIQTVPSKLESVAISVNRPIIEGFGQWEQFDLLSTLQPFSDTLHTIQVRLQPSSPALSLLANGGSYGFPHVNTFGIVYENSTPALFASPVLVQTFPALTHLQLIPATRDRHGRRRRRQLEMASRLREDSQVRRSQYPGGSAFPALSSLVECSGPLFDVYALALDHALSTLQLWQHITAADIPILRAVLEDTCPGRLSLSTEMDDLRTTFETLRPLFAKPPPRVDLTISLSPVFWENLHTEGELNQFRGFLGLFALLPPPGLAELNLFFELPSDARPAERSVVSDILVAFAKWVPTAPALASLRISCRVAVDGDWQWPDLAEDDDLENPFSVLTMPLSNPFDFDDFDDFDDGGDDGEDLVDYDDGPELGF